MYISDTASRPNKTSKLMSSTRYHEQTQTKQNIAFVLNGRQDKYIKIDKSIQGYMNKKLDVANNSVSLLMNRE